MSRRKNDYDVKPGARYSGVLYTARRTTMPAQEYTPKNSAEQSKLRLLWGIAVSAVSEKLSLLFRRHRGKDSRGAYANPHRAKTSDSRTVVFAGSGKTREPFFDKNSRPFYMSVAAGGAALIVCSALLSAGIWDPGTNNITVNDSGRIVSATTGEHTVGDFLARNGIAIEDGDVLEISEETPITNGMEIIIRRAMPLSIDFNGEVTEIRMLAGTVSEAIDKAGITIGEEDEIYPVKESFISSGMTITIIDVEEKTVTEKETIHYKEITKNDSSLAKGRTKVSQKGVDGTQENTIKIVYKNGVEVRRILVKETVVKEAVDEITLVGTYVAPAKKQPSGGSSTPNKNGTNYEKATDSDGKLTKAPSVSEIHSNTSLYDHKSVPAPAASIIKKTLVVNRLTAYTHTGNRTATGTWPKIGTIAADPKQIPYGTKLYIPGYGYGRVEDTGSNRHDANTYCLDLFMDTRKECLQWGVKRSWKVYILK